MIVLRKTMEAAVAREQERFDITLELRAEIMKRDWAAVHVSGDRSSAVCMAERVKRPAMPNLEPEAALAAQPLEARHWIIRRV
jgi:hypothetical protein